MSAKAKVIVDPNFREMDEVFSPADRERLFALADPIWAKDEPMPQEEFLAALPEAEAIICAGWSRYGDCLPQAKKLRAILTISGGWPRPNQLDYDYCFAHGIRVLSAAPAFAPAVAEMALGMALSAGRGIVKMDRQMRQNTENWERRAPRETFMLFGKPVGFIGYGSIARALQPLLQPFGVDISVYDPWLGNGFLRRQGVTPADLDTLLETSKYIFILATPSQENKALLTRSHLERIQPGAVMVLISRAHVVDFDALTEIVDSGRFFAAIDVFPKEPLEADHPIRRVENAILTHHQAGGLPEGRLCIGEWVVDDLEAILQGFPPQRMQSAAPELIRRY